ncbi:kelch-like protein diablo [Orbicella faveolata]|uniref:kelch-like protein diablo n=1 Tax=Orbicella faveolata TaxID=48498 RepID=UPI0009E2E1BC|nr:kelch-like protein diablo [Orbicella faveolata]
MKEVFNGGGECYFAQSPRNCLKIHENAIVACGKNSTLCYIPSVDKWYKLSDMLSTRYFFSQSISVCQGKLFFIGDTYDSDTYGCPAEHYDPSVNTWFPLGSFKQRVKWCTVVTFQGLLYVMGGVEQKENKLLNTVQRYNPDTNLWQVVSSLSSPRSSICAVGTRSYLYAIGGKSDVEPVNIVERFDPKEKAWCLAAPTLGKRVAACGVAVNEKMFVFGGFRSEKYSHSSFCEMYDPVTDMWSSIANTITPRGYTSAVSFKGNIFVCGEFGEDASLQIYNIVTSEWKFCTKFPQSTEKFKISCLRIPREVLDKCEVLS